MLNIKRTKILFEVLTVAIITAGIVVIGSCASRNGVSSKNDRIHPIISSSAGSLSEKNSASESSSASNGASNSSSSLPSETKPASSRQTAAPSKAGTTIQQTAAAPQPVTTTASVPQPLPMVPVDNTPPPAPQQQDAAETHPSSPENFWGDTGMTSINKVYEYGKTLLSADEQGVYDQIAQGVLNVQPSISINSSLDMDSIEKVWLYYDNDHAEDFYVNGASIFEEGNAYKITPNYLYDAATVLTMKQSMDAAAAGIINSVKSNLSNNPTDYDEEKALHDQVVEAFRYDIVEAEHQNTDPLSHTAYGGFVSDKAVCDGYSKAMKLLLDSQGIESLYVTGTAETSSGSGGHAWDIVQIGGIWDELDVTFDDPVGVSHGIYDTSNTIPSYTYFNFNSQTDIDEGTQHTLGTFNAADPFSSSEPSENYAVMPAVG